MQKLLCSFVLVPVLLATAHQRAVRLDDNSDWWSILKDDLEPAPELKPGNLPLPRSNFQLGGVPLGSDFNQIRSRLGPAPEVERGDASTGRHQLCYVSAVAHGKKTYLVFEVGEVTYASYLFKVGADWNGSNFCAASKTDFDTAQTPTGLKLGLAPAQVKQILGEPDLTQRDNMIYVREFKRKTSPQEFSQMRKDYPGQLSDATAHQMFDYYDVEMYIRARFTHSGLTYLAISQTETD